MFNDNDAIKQLSAQWWEYKKAGASQAVLDAVHAQAQALRKQQGYTADASGTIYSALKAAGETLTGTGAKEVVSQAAETAAQAAEETYYVFTDGSGDYNPAAYATKGKIDGNSISGYAVLGLVGLVMLDKLLK